MMNLNKEGHSLAFPQVQSDLAEVVLWWSVWRVVGAGIGARSRKSLDMLHSKLRFGSPEPEALTVCLVSLAQRQISPLMCLLGWGRRRRSETQTLIAWHFGGIFNLCLCLFDLCLFGGRGCKEKLFWSGSSTKGMGNHQTNGFSVCSVHSPNETEKHTLDSWRWPVKLSWQRFLQGDQIK